MKKKLLLKSGALLSATTLTLSAFTFADHSDGNKALAKEAIFQSNLASSFNNKDQVLNSPDVSRESQQALGLITGNWQVNTLDKIRLEIARQKEAGLPVYVVQWGDTLEAIAAITNQSVDDLVTKNGIHNRHFILTGDVLLGILDRPLDTTITQATFPINHPIITNNQPNISQLSLAQTVGTATQPQIESTLPQVTATPRIVPLIESLEYSYHHLTDKQTIPYPTQTIENSELEQGKTQTRQVGQDGERTIVTEVTKYGEATISSREVSNTLTKEPIAEIIEVGTKEVTETPLPTTEQVTRTEDIPFTVQTVDNPELDKGITRIRQEGKNGVRTITTEVTSLDGQIIQSKEISNQVTTEPVQQIVEVGTKEVTETPLPTTEQVTRTEEIPFTVQTVDNPELDRGTTRIRQEGKNGVRTITTEVTSLDGQIIQSKEIANQVTTEPVQQIVEVGTKEVPETPLPTTEQVTRTEDIPFSVQTVDNPELDKGTTRIRQEGKNGVRTITTEVTSLDGQIIQTTEIANQVTTEPVQQIVEVGTKEAPEAPLPVTEQVTRTEEIPFSVQTVDNPELDKGTTRIRQEGKNGVRTITTEVTSLDGQIIQTTEIANQVTTEPIQQIVEVGTKEEVPKVVTVANLGEAKQLIAKDNTLTSILISDGRHQALLKKDRLGYNRNIGLADWSLHFQNNIPVVAFYNGDTKDISLAANQAITAARSYNLINSSRTLKPSEDWVGVEMPYNQTFNSDNEIKLLTGVSYLKGNGSTLIATAANIPKDGNYAVIKFETGAYDAVIDGFRIDMLMTDRLRGIKAEGTKNTQISNNDIFNADYNVILVAPGSSGSSDVTITGNKIQAQPGRKDYERPYNAIDISGAPIDVTTNGRLDPQKVASLTDDPQLKEVYTKATQDALNSGTSLTWHLYVKGQGMLLPAHPTRTVTDVNVNHNFIEGGRYGIFLTYTQNSQISHNTISRNTRNIALQNGNSHNTIDHNLLTEAISTGVLLGYKSSDNHVHHNQITSSQFSGQAGIIVDQGSNNNLITDNTIEAGGSGLNWLLYAGSDISGTTFTNNIASGKINRSAVGIEAIWDYASASGDIASYTTKSDGDVISDTRFGKLYYNGGNGDSDRVTISGNLIAPEVASSRVPVAYFAADTSAGWNQASSADATYTYPTYRITGNLTNLSSENNLVLGQKGTDYHELVREHENGATVNGQAQVGGFSAIGISTLYKDNTYTTSSYTMTSTDDKATLLGSKNNTQLIGNARNNELLGNIGNNSLDGKEGNDILNGGFGNDSLTGSLGSDHFVFDNLFDDSKNVDTITDFDASQGDRFLLSTKIFGPLNGVWFSNNRETVTEQTKFFYDNGTLYFINRLASSPQEIRVAILTNKANLTQSDFIIE